MSAAIEDRADWKGPDIVHSDAWSHVWSESEIKEIIAALEHARSRRLTFETLNKEGFPLPTVSGRIERAREMVENGLGLYLLRGFPTSNFSTADLRLIYWGLGKHIGTVVSQSHNGDVLGDVRNIGADVHGATGRGYTSKQELAFHTDSCDVVGLFVLQTAKSGGLSLIVSSLAIHNEIARTRPDLLQVLYEPYYWSWQGQEPAGTPPYYQQPIYTVCQDRFASRYIRPHIESAQRFTDAPRLSDMQIEAMDLVDLLAGQPDFHLSMMFEPGDLQLLNNHVTYHARTEFEDYPEPERRRHLLRMWLSVPNSRPLSSALGAIYRDQRPGSVRGGFPSRHGAFVYETRGV